MARPRAGRKRSNGESRDLSQLAGKMLRLASRGESRIDFLRAVSKMLVEFSGCDGLELRVSRADLHYRCEATRRPEAFRFFAENGAETTGPSRPRAGGRKSAEAGGALERLCRDMFRGRVDRSLPCFTTEGSFWTGDARRFAWYPASPTSSTSSRKSSRGALPATSFAADYRSLAIIRFPVGEQAVALLLLKSRRAKHFTRKLVQSYEHLAQLVGMALTNRRAQWALRERVKELTCLYGIAQIAQQPGLSIGQSLHAIVELLPPAWQYPADACARILLDGQSFVTPDFQQTRFCQSAEIVVGGKPRGLVEVIYRRDKPHFAEGVFLKEERSLIDTVAQEVALIVERREAEEQKGRLEEQLRHADRLATIGQLAAGVAHELNEPLANILGFAQLMAREPGLPERAGRDVQKIVRTSLHARDIIQKLLIFARQQPPLKAEVDLNEVVQEGLHFSEAGCAQAGIEVRRKLAPDLPRIKADASQLRQILTNLVVNAVQAMPQGGRLSIETRASEGLVSLIVSDTGTGMTEEVRKKIFIPFFTTKDVNQGTGLGLAVVHGIITAHGGTIEVESEVGKGTRFVVRLPAARAASVE